MVWGSDLHRTPHLKLLGGIDGRMTCDFMPFSTVFQSYQNNEEVIMKAVCKEPCLRLKRSLSQVGLRLEPLV